MGLQLIIITDKSKTRRGGEGVGVMKDEDLNLEEIESSHTLGKTGVVDRVEDVSSVFISSSA